ncbi:hypothetical protein CC80DRAFT_575824 [Byssothecium circinans]|uniref:Uncharacterized protein n=1 Tax=Byssothecium circinans TaxID=147558 RepID=A0A6A5TGH7_9PLEO|nr:hypothetical protein CC80DRAFT_575824 [Byssothecium circinans]
MFSGAQTEGDGETMTGEEFDAALVEVQDGVPQSKLGQPAMGGAAVHPFPYMILDREDWEQEHIFICTAWLTARFWRSFRNDTLWKSRLRAIVAFPRRAQSTPEHRSHFWP